MLGADAIYMGINKFNARNMAENFDIDSYINAIEYAHQRGIKVYLTLNTLLKTDEISEALDIVTKLYSKGLDAVIVQDIGLARLIHEIMPKLHLHASTQMSVYSLSQVRFLEKIGFKRVVLARELSLEEIEYICKNTNLEIEVFVHGALCVSLSGQCLLSSVIGNRSANRGECAQPCRMKYSLYDKTDKEIVKKTFHFAEKYGKNVYAIVSNMTIAMERRDFLRKTACFVCNQQEAGQLFSEDYSDLNPEEMAECLTKRIQSAHIPQMVVTMGSEGAAYADQEGNYGVYPAMKVDVVDTTGAGDAFFAGVCVGLTYVKSGAAL